MIFNEYSIKIVFSIIIVISGFYILLDSFKQKELSKRRFLISIIPIICGAYFSYDSIVSSIEANKKQETVDKKIQTHETKLDNILSIEEIKKLGDRAVSNGDRNAYLKLKNIVENFGKDRSLAISQIARIKSHHFYMSSINGIKIEKYTQNKKHILEKDIETKELIKILLLDRQYLYRARSAQILLNRNEKYVHEALLLSIFSDNNIEVLRESTKAFENLTDFKNPDFFQPYHCLVYWYDNSEKVSNTINKDNETTIIPLVEFEQRIKKNILKPGNKYMNYWWGLSVEMCRMLLLKQKIEEPTGGNNTYK